MAISGGDGSIILTTQVDQTGLKRGMASMKSGVAGLSKSFTKIGAAIGVAFGVGALIKFGKQAVQLASDLQEVQNVVDVAFGDMAYRMEEFADTAIETFGISELTAKQTGSSFMAMAKGMQFADDVAADMALTLTGLSADMASFYNIRQEEAKTALSAVYTGETETLKRYGVLITEVNLQEFARQQGITKSINAMTQQEKVMLRYQYILQATQLAQGDFVRTQDSWANQTRILSERWKEMATIFGEAFMAIGLLVLPVINSIIIGLTKVAEAARVVAQWIYKAFTGKELKTTQSQGTAFSSVGIGANEAADGIQALENVTGKANKGAIEAADGMEALGDATGKANKEAKKSLAGFDDLQILTSNIADSANSASDALGGVGGIGGGGIGGIGDVGGNMTFEETGGFEKEEEFSFLQQRLDELKNAFSGIKDIDLSNLSSSLGLLKEPLQGLAEIAWDIILWGIEEVIIPLTEFTIEEVLPRFFETLSKALRLFKTILDEGFKIFKQFYDEFLKPIAEYTAEGFLQLWDALNENLEEFVTIVENSTAWQDLQTILELIYDVLEPIVKTLIDFVVWIGKLTMNNAWTDLKWAFLDIEDALGLIADTINGDFDGAWEHLKDLMWDNRVDKAKEKLDNLKTAFDEVKTKVDEFVEDWKLKIDDMVESWKTKISDWWTNNVEPWFTKEKWEELFFKIGESLANAIVGVNGFVEKWKTNITNWWNDDVTPWFTAKKWKELFNNIVTSISNFFTGEDGFVQTWKNKISEWWTNEVTPWFTVEKWKELGEHIKDGLVDGFNGAINGIRGIINKILDGFQGLVNGAIDMLNSLIGGWNKVADVTPGLSSIGRISRVDLSKYKLPLLAQGAVLPPNKPFMAIVGDQKHGTNIEAPLQTIVDAFNIALQGNANYGGGNTEVVLEIDGREFGRAVVEQGNRENRRIGTRLVIA